MQRRAVSVIGLGFGDEGKGATVDYLARELDATLVVKANGGCQSEHNVVDARGRHFCFSQLGAATMAYADTHISQHFMIEPLSLQREALALSEIVGVTNPYTELTVDPRARVTTPIHQAANRKEERARGEGRHGSTGRGIGKTVEYSIHYPEYTILAEDLNDIRILEEKLGHMADFYKVLDFNFQMLAKRLYLTSQNIEIAKDEEVISDHETIIFEHSQGVLLDELHGFAPHNTWSICTSYNSREMIKGLDIDHRVVGCLRSYMSRHGAGPFPTESDIFTQNLPELHNRTYEWAGKVRKGYYDEVLLRYALMCDPYVSSLSVSHVDFHTHLPDVADLVRMDNDNKSEQLFRDMKTQSADVYGTSGMTISNGRPWDLDWVEESLRRPVCLTARGPRTTDRQMFLNPFEVASSERENVASV